MPDLKCSYQICGTRQSGPKPVSQQIRLNSFKFQAVEDSLGFFCSPEHAILFAARLSKSKISTLLKKGKIQKEKGSELASQVNSVLEEDDDE